MFRLGPWEIVLIVAVVIIIFGPKRLPELGKGIGQFFKNFKNGISGNDDKNDQNPPKA
ncbi:twin-arginine translocase TatA/TatE family subunit [bacterium]|nr:twin-arginine translocase TatA/TatE family subunit [bacterium]